MAVEQGFPIGSKINPARDVLLHHGSNLRRNVVNARPALLDSWLRGRLSLPIGKADVAGVRDNGVATFAEGFHQAGADALRSTNRNFLLCEH